jgi:hypothetical protein
MTDDGKEILAAIAIIASIACVVLVGVLLVDSYACEAHWSRSGLRYDWGPIQRCMVQRKDGTWVPSTTIREIDP